MKFSYSLVKQFVPKLKSKAQVVEALSLHAFEAEDASGNTFEVNLPPNRYADASSHWGIAKEVAVIFDWIVDWGGMKKLPVVDFAKPSRNCKPQLNINIDEPQLCTRYTACVMDEVTVKSSPRWMQETLKECGLRPINNIVDAMNYVMLEMGQPLHAFDADKLEGAKIIVRRAKKKGESIITIDGVKYDLAPETVVIADAKHSIAIAGIKGGHGPEVTAATKRIVIESATFDPVSIYRTSKMLKLVTDASQRFSHRLSENLAELGLSRAAYVIQEITGAKILEVYDSQKKPAPKHELRFDILKFNAFIGTSLSNEVAAGYLRRLGFINKGKDVWKVPLYRTDIETHEDIAEEVVRLYGLGNLKSVPPRIHLGAAAQDETIVLKEKTRKILSELGLNEIYGNSFIAKEAEIMVEKAILVSLENPISKEFYYLRPALAPNLLASAESNAKFGDTVTIFEVGKTFLRNTKGIVEQWMLGMVFATKGKESFFNLKGVLQSFLKSTGITDSVLFDKKGKPAHVGKYWMDKSSVVTLRLGAKEIGVMGTALTTAKGWHTAIVEIQLDVLKEAVAEEMEYLPPSRYPAVMRDISILLNTMYSVGDVMQAIQLANMRMIRDVDLVDEYSDPKWTDKESLTFRIVFQQDNRTLTAEEVDKQIEKIKKLLKTEFKVEFR
ncbi:MAG: phenylalanine--tRNA ligase subunit beta [Patescibacteria group bacterium]